MEIPCHKSTSVWSKSTPNSMTIPCHLSRFYLLSLLEHDLDFAQVCHGIFMAFAKKIMGFPLDLVSFSTKLPSKWHEKIRVIFFTGINLFSRDDSSYVLFGWSTYWTTVLNCSVPSASSSYKTRSPAMTLMKEVLPGVVQLLARTQFSFKITPIQS